MTHRQVAVLLVTGAALVGAVVCGGLRSRAVLSDSYDRRPLAAVTPDAVARTGTMLFAGDAMLARDVGTAMASRNDWTWPFAAIASVTASADLMFLNLETTISDGGAQAGCTYCFRSDPRVIQGLNAAGVDVVTFANNHAFDFGSEAFVDTLEHLSRAGIGVTGAGHNADLARTPVIRTVGNTRVAFLAYTNLLPAAAAAGPDKPGVAIYDSVYLTQDVALARQDADVVVVSFHAGEEYQTVPNAWQQRVYRGAIDAGADLVIGHHPHVVQPVEQYGAGWIAYSLGNFIFDQYFSAATMAGLMLEVTLRDGQVQDVRELPIVISRSFQPALVPSARVR